MCRTCVQMLTGVAFIHILLNEIAIFMNEIFIFRSNLGTYLRYLLDWILKQKEYGEQIWEKIVKITYKPYCPRLRYVYMHVFDVDVDLWLEHKNRCFFLSAISVTVDVCITISDVYQNS